MSNDLEILTQKFQNFKKFVSEVGTNKEKVNLLVSQTDEQMLTRSSLLLMVHQKTWSIDMITNITCLELGIDKPEDKDKIKKYFNCFIEYLSIIHKDQNINNIELSPELADKLKNEVNSKLNELIIKSKKEN